MIHSFRHDIYLPSTFELLTKGGDERIELDPRAKTNKYGCRPIPDCGLIAFGSATASTISEAGFDAAEEVRTRLLEALRNREPAEIYMAEISRLRSEFADLYRLTNLPGLEMIVSSSGTDAHMLAARLVDESAKIKTLAITVQSTETGSGIAGALKGAESALGKSVDVKSIDIRAKDCSLRSTAVVADELEAMVSTAVARYDRILITLTDVSKTGILAPCPIRAQALKRRWPDIIEILVDASQFRLTPSTLQSYLAANCLVVITGSKFINGPAFSAMLLIPEAAASRLMTQSLNPALGIASLQPEWPRHWNGVRSLPNSSNFGLLLRWKAALADLRAFRNISEEDIEKVVRAFHDAIVSALHYTQEFELLEQSALQCRPFAEGAAWDQVQTIFPFLLFHNDPRGKRTPVSTETTQEIYYQMRKDISPAAGRAHNPISSMRCELGQPVSCGELQGTRVSALRLSLSARLIVKAVEEGDRGIASLIEQGLLVLEKAAFLAK
ncbi:hypothetical protein [Rhizobium jaguaris]|uniref:Aminotransferase class V-fold PLP-dependent enzyme n=1 Tax=Rhizobium jaguaris TaxID=1312183 RepID=A0A387FZA2_9HYPH|nr:hypothetical protein [Rhizobium jaguaris]AYG64380.1 hypothetical protein CCGE525_37160 [Rhizobium jaguaris]